MELGAYFKLVGEVLGIVGVLVAAVVVLKSRLPKETSENYRLTVESMRARMEEQTTEMTDMKVRMTAMEGELNVVKTLPLQQLSADYHKISDAITLFAETTRTTAEVSRDTHKALETLMQMHVELYGEVKKNTKARNKKS